MKTIALDINEATKAGYVFEKRDGQIEKLYAIYDSAQEAINCVEGENHEPLAHVNSALKAVFNDVTLTFATNATHPVIAKAIKEAIEEAKEWEGENYEEDEVIIEFRCVVQ